MSLERFGIRWNGSHEPMATPMDDGYWTPWHIAEAEIAALRQEIATGHGQYHRDYAAECDSLLAAKDKVIADLREQRDNAQIAVAMKQGEIADLSDEIAALRQQSDDLRDVLSRNGFTRCDIAACNCGSWHHTHGLRARWEEIKDALDDSGHPLTNENGNLVIRALGELVAERDALRERCGRLARYARAAYRISTISHVSRELNREALDASNDCVAHNDLAPAAKEQTDG